MLLCVLRGRVQRGALRRYLSQTTPPPQRRRLDGTPQTFVFQDLHSHNVWAVPSKGGAAAAASRVRRVDFSDFYRRFGLGGGGDDDGGGAPGEGGSDAGGGGGSAPAARSSGGSGGSSGSSGSSSGGKGGGKRR